MSASSELKRAWEKRFPPLSAAWSHWRLEGDGFLLGVVSGERLVDALRLLEENHERYASILVRRATVNSAGECTAVDHGGFEVSNRHNDRHLRHRSYEGPNTGVQPTPEDGRG